MFDKKLTNCSKCNYVEPGGSARYVAFVTEVLSEMLIDMGVQKIRLAGTNVASIEGCLQANVLLPAIVINAQINAKNLGGTFADINLTTVDDPNGYYRKRVITSTAKIRDPAIGMLALGETLCTAFQQSMKFEEYADSGILCLDLLAPISALQVQNIIKYAHFNEMDVRERAQAKDKGMTNEQ